MSRYLSHINTEKGITLVMDNGVSSVSKNHRNYKSLLQALKDKDFRVVPELATISSHLSHKLNKSSKDFKVEHGIVKYKNEVMPKALSSRLIQMINQNLDLEPIRKFWDNLRRNPSTRSREQLYSFLEHNALPITEDGCFIAYKYVTNDFMSCHANKDGTRNDNHPGKVVRMNREDVDPNPNRTCSHGLHVAAYGYVSSEENIVEVKVNPKHVVAVPTDYNGQKIRVCEYTVLHSLNNDEPLDISKSDSVVYNYRTYYLKWLNQSGISEKNVTSHKPSRFVRTLRAKTTEEAIEKFKKLY